MRSSAWYYKIGLAFHGVLWAIFMSCSTSNHQLVTGPQIENPFKDMEYNSQRMQSNKEPITIKATNADHIFEVAIPRDPSSEDLDLVVPLSGLNAEGTRLASRSSMIPNNLASNNFSKADHSASNGRKIASEAEKTADQEIVKTFAQANKRKAQDLGDLDERLGTFQPAEEGNPSYLAGMDKLRTEYFAKRFELALIEANKLIKYYPTSSKVYMMKGTILKKMGFLDLATRAYEQAYELDPSNSTLRSVLGGEKSSDTRKN